MQSQSIEQNVSNNIIQDTWEIREDTATWYINLPLDFTILSYQEINVWYEKTVVETLNSFSELARVWHVAFRASPEEEVKSIELEWQLEVPYEQYCKSLLKAIREFSSRISTLEMQVDFNVFTNTLEFPNQATKNWVRYLGKFSFCGGKIHSHPFVYLDLNNTLFCPSSIYEQNNSELYSLNQPMLEQALKNWEKKIGKIDDIEGIEGIYEYGFKPDKE
jgi:hypothetical protein